MRCEVCAAGRRRQICLEAERRIRSHDHSLADQEKRDWIRIIRKISIERYNWFREVNSEIDRDVEYKWNIAPSVQKTIVNYACRDTFGARVSHLNIRALWPLNSNLFDLEYSIVIMSHNNNITIMSMCIKIMYIKYNIIHNNLISNF